MGSCEHVRIVCFVVAMGCVLQLLSWLVWCVPAYVDDLVILIWVVDRHGHVIIGCNNLFRRQSMIVNRSLSVTHLFKVLAESLLEELRIALEYRVKQLV